MGEIFAGPGLRTCSRAACRGVAVATLKFDYPSRRAWLEDLKAGHDPSSYDLCAIHAERFGPPHGWVAEDHRTFPQPIMELSPQSRPSEQETPAEPQGADNGRSDAGSQGKRSRRMPAAARQG
ncbi:MAG: DUF3499 family protein [Actinomycetota bacterium]